MIEFKKRMSVEVKIISPPLPNSIKKYLSFDIGARNLALCVVSYDFNNNNNNNNNTSSHSWSKLTISHAELIDLVQESARGKKQRAGAKPKNAKSINIHVLCEILIKVLHERIGLLDGVTGILAEQQPMLRGASTGSVGSARMKIIQHVILCFYQMYYLFHPHLQLPTIMPASPSNKLKCVIDESNFLIPPLASTDKNTDYKQRKALATQNCAKLLNWCTISPELTSMWQDLKKQNDIADCILQAVFELQTEGCKMLKKINIIKTKKPKPTKRKIEECLTTVCSDEDIAITPDVCRVQLDCSDVSPDVCINSPKKKKTKVKDSIINATTTYIS